MHHVTSQVLRRLADEPLAVPDRARRHCADCDRCQALSTEIAVDAALASRVLRAPQQVADVDLEWILLQDRLADPGPTAHRAIRTSPRVVHRLAGISVGAGTAAVAGVLAVGAAAAAVLTTVYAPTQVAPVHVSAADLRAIQSISGIGTGQLSGDLPASGSRQLAFGELSWTTASPPVQVSSIAQASALAQIAFPIPAALPPGVGAPTRIMVQPQVTATIRFSQSAGPGIAGSTLQVTGGPGIAVQYGSTSGNTRLVTLAIVAARRPVASSAGATASQLETFLLSRPGMPAALADEIRELGKPGAVLPVPVPSGMWEQLEHIGGAPAVLLTEPDAFASGVIWEDRDGIVRGVGGLLDSEDVLGVAHQITQQIG
jgi:hypothetical protein